MSVTDSAASWDGCCECAGDWVEAVGAPVGGATVVVGAVVVVAAAIVEVVLVTIVTTAVVLVTEELTTAGGEAVLEGAVAGGRPSVTSEATGRSLRVG